MVEVQMAKQHDTNTALFGQGELDTNRASIQEHRVINQEPATLLTDRPVHCVHKTIGPVTTQYSYAHRSTSVLKRSGWPPVGTLLQAHISVVNRMELTRITVRLYTMLDATVSCAPCACAISPNSSNLTHNSFSSRAVRLKPKWIRSILRCEKIRTRTRSVPRILCKPIF